MVIQLKRGSKDTWATKNFILASGEIGVEKGENATAKFKIGNGVSPWNDLPYANITQEDLDAISITYTTTRPIPQNVGMLQAGKEFFDAPISEVFDEIFYGTEVEPPPPPDPDMTVSITTTAESIYPTGSTASFRVSTTISHGTGPYTATLFINETSIATNDTGVFEVDNITTDSTIYVSVTDSTSKTVDSNSVNIRFILAVYTWWEPIDSEDPDISNIPPDTTDLTKFTAVTLNNNETIVAEFFGDDNSNYRPVIIYPKSWNNITKIETVDIASGVTYALPTILGTNPTDNTTVIRLDYNNDYYVLYNKEPAIISITGSQYKLYF